MSTNAVSWFYAEPEPKPYYISERLNGTFWQARITDFYWTGQQVERPYGAQGVDQDGTTVNVRWVPADWFSLAVPDEYAADDLVAAISKRVLGMDAALSYTDSDGRRVYEWYRDGGRSRWKEIQGNPAYGQPKRMAAR